LHLKVNSFLLLVSYTLFLVNNGDELKMAYEIIEYITENYPEYLANNNIKIALKD